MKHKRVVVPRHGPPDVMQVVEEDIPEPKPGEVRVRVLAAGVSAFDLMVRRSGSIPGFPRVPFTPGVDAVGIAEKLGEGGVNSRARAKGCRLHRGDAPVSVRRLRGVCLRSR